jgi:hypothetical protein
MSNKNKNQSAFATSCSRNEFDSGYLQEGLTKREYFAAKAMQGILVDADPIQEEHFAYLANQAVNMADALLKALEQKENTEDQQ